MTPSDKLFKLRCLAFGYQFDIAVCAIAHPTCEAKLPGPVPCRRTEIYPLDSTAHNHVNPLKHRHGFLPGIRFRGEGGLLDTTASLVKMKAGCWGLEVSF
jgi:hypothetical protein